MDDFSDFPTEGSAFVRHYSFPYEQLDSLDINIASTVVDPTIGCYKSTARTLRFPLLPSKNPVAPKLSAFDEAIFQLVSNYEDMLFCRRSPDNVTVRTIYCAHALNHSLRSRKLMMKNNEREAKMGISDSLRDQGFHRARTLILAPTKEAARRIVHTFLRLMPEGSTVSHRRRFDRDFGPQPGEADKEKRKGRKPSDYEEWFSCNTSDHFRIGIAFAKKSVKLYSAFVESDLILASPLGLQTIIDEEKEKDADLQYITASTELLIIDQAEMLLMQNWANVQKIVSLLNQRPTKATFASAARIRLGYLAGYGRRYRQTLIFSAVSAAPITLLTGDCENFQGLNFIPPQPHYPGLYPSYLPEAVRVPGTKRNPSKLDSSHPTTKRGRMDGSLTSCLEEVKLNLITFAVSGQALRGVQLSTEDSDVDSHSDDESFGEVKRIKLDISVEELRKNQLSMVERISSHDLTYLADRAVPLARMNAFKIRILPRLRRGVDPRVLIYVPAFYDLEELRLILTAESLDFCCIHEYTEDSEAERFRTLFADGRIRILLMSERYYFFRRRKLRGAHTFIFYGPPTFPWFVKELLDSGYKSDGVSSEQATVVQLTILYYPPFEAAQVSTITGRIDI
ncbi:hypothetical protein CRM22_004212 [Opisthorchis felineus]|uniref:U3 small nucleolar RNA-associated protein 25 homolog n=1 Tax=Opisthorchis felineus TaxID=147828 RepID=A0A4S2LY40_OPIFE|nr:hypothetical protein CRM22_004212 [Opisthorchis felineus]